VSKTTPAEYHGFCFWVFDVCASILFAEMATVARETPAAGRSSWLAGWPDAAPSPRSRPARLAVVGPDNVRNRRDLARVR